MPDRSLNGFGFGFPSLPSFPPQSATSVFSHVDFPQLFHLFHCYLWIAAWENNASSCFGRSMCRHSTIFYSLEPPNFCVFGYITALQWYLKVKTTFSRTVASYIWYWSAGIPCGLVVLRWGGVHRRRYFQPSSAKPCSIKQYLSINDCALDAAVMGRLHTPTGRTDERLSTELEWKLVDLVTWKQCYCIFLQRSLTEVWNVHVSDFMCERVGGTVFECGRDGQWKWWKEKECWSLKGASERGSQSESVYRTQSHAKWLYWSLMFIKMALLNRRGEERVIFSRLLLKFKQHFLNLFLSRRR